MMGWQWYHLDHMQIICTSLQTDNHDSTSPLSFYRPDALPAAQPIASNHTRHNNQEETQTKFTEKIVVKHNAYTISSV